MNDLLKKGIAECIGTFVLVFCACGVAMYTNGSPVPTALAFGLVIVAMAYSVGRISGCHVNPAVSLGCLLTKRMSLKEFGVYVGAQLVGAIVGGVAIMGIFKWGGKTIGNGCNTALDYSGTLDSITAGGYVGAILAEVILTCIFVYVILNVTADDSDANKKAGIVIGLTLTLVHLIGLGLTGTSVNPARSIGTAIADAIYNGNTDSLAQVWIFIVAPLIGGALAAVLYNCLHGKNKELVQPVEAAEQPAEKN